MGRTLADGDPVNEHPLGVRLAPLGSLHFQNEMEHWLLGPNIDTWQPTGIVNTPQFQGVSYNCDRCGGSYSALQSCACDPPCPAPSPADPVE